MLTLKQLKEMEPDTIFATGEALDSPYGINMSNSGKLLRWVAVRGGIHDWCIYCHFADRDIEWIKRHGDKVCGEEHIKKLVECNDESFKLYRY